MKRRLGLVLMILATVLCLLAGVPREVPAEKHFQASGRAGTVSRPAMPEGSVSVNSGEIDELMTLPGVGETLALNIIEERERNGPFHYPEDLTTVKGIGVGRLEKIFSLINLE